MRIVALLRETLRATSSKDFIAAFWVTISFGSPFVCLRAPPPVGVVDPLSSVGRNMIGPLLS